MHLRFPSGCPFKAKKQLSRLISQLGCFGGHITRLRCRNSVCEIFCRSERVRHGQMQYKDKTRFRIIPVQMALQVTVRLTEKAQHTYPSFQKKKLLASARHLNCTRNSKFWVGGHVITYSSNICILQHRMATRPAIDFGTNGDGLRPVHAAFK